jgi:hypothetical protein
MEDAKDAPRQDLQIRGPDDAELLIYPSGDAYVWKIRNGSLHSVEQLRLEIVSIRTFDIQKSAFREPVDFPFRWPLVKNIEAGAVTKTTIFVRFESDQLRLWNSDAMPVLLWPNGDPTAIRRWRLSMKVTGLSREWLIDLFLRWPLGTKRMELRQSGESVPADRSGSGSMKIERSPAAIPEPKVTGESDYSAKLPADGPANPESTKAASPERNENIEREPPETLSAAANAKRSRALTVAKLIRELNILRPTMFEDTSEYERLRGQHPEFLTFTIADRHPHLKAKLLAIQASARHIRLAQELAGAHHGRQLATIQDDWKAHKPPEFKRRA